MSDRDSAVSPTPPAPRPMRRGLRILLVASLGVNLAVIGVVAGAVINHARHAPPPVVRDLGFGPYGEALSHADKIALRHAFGRETGGFLAGRREARAEFARLLDLLRADPFDHAALEAQMGQQEKRAVERLALGQKLLVERIEAMTPEERHGFADRLEAALAHKPHRPPPPRAPSDDGKHD